MNNTLVEGEFSLPGKVSGHYNNLTREETYFFWVVKLEGFIEWPDTWPRWGKVSGHFNNLTREETYFFWVV